MITLKIYLINAPLISKCAEDTQTLTELMISDSTMRNS